MKHNTEESAEAMNAELEENQLNELSNTESGVEPEPVESDSAEDPDIDDDQTLDNLNDSSEEIEFIKEDIKEIPELAEKEAKIQELIGDLQRTRADFENYRKQNESQKKQAMSSARYGVVEKFLPLVDDFARAISTYPEQLQPLEKNFTKLMKSLGLQQIDSRSGVEFNPDFHEAISVDDDEGDIEVVTETLRPGYLYEGAVLRAALVKVGHADK